MFEKIVPLPSFIKTFFFIWNWVLINVGSYIEWFYTLDHKRIGDFSFLYFYFFGFWKKKKKNHGWYGENNGKFSTR